MSIAFSLVADIGGTNTRVAVAQDGKVDQSSVRRYANAEQSDMSGVLRRYMDDTAKSDFASACVAMAGPVRDGVGKLTNLDWRIDRDVLSETTGAKVVAVLNDLQAQGHAIGHLAPASIRQILPQRSEKGYATKLVIGLGTGFNAAPVYDTAAGRFVPPSECGHASLPVRNSRDLALVEALRASHGFAAIEDALSGRGLEAVHRSLHEESKRAAVIIDALERGDPQARETGRQFVQLLGTVVGNLALIHLPFGGIYLAGGVARAIAPYLDTFDFAGSMRDKGRFGEYLEQFGVCVVEDDYAALTGCAAHLSRLLAGQSS
ncbi:MAG: glucokinase [Paracoccaceae bacterium]|jgi:glucokinase